MRTSAFNYFVNHTKLRYVYIQQTFTSKYNIKTILANDNSKEKTRLIQPLVCARDYRSVKYKGAKPFKALCQ